MDNNIISAGLISFKFDRRYDEQYEKRYEKNYERQYLRGRHGYLSDYVYRSPKIVFTEPKKKNG